MDEPFKDNLVEDFNYDYDYPDTNNGEKSLTKWQELDIILRKMLCGGILSTMSILGIIGNIMSIVVFTRPKMNSSSDTILLGKNFGCSNAFFIILTYFYYIWTNLAFCSLLVIYNDLGP